MADTGFCAICGERIWSCGGAWRDNNGDYGEPRGAAPHFHRPEDLKERNG